MSEKNKLSTSRTDLDSYTHGEDGKLDHVVYIYDDPNPRIPVFAGVNADARERAGRLAASYNACRNLPTAFMEAGGVEMMLKACSKIYVHMKCVGTLGHGTFDELNGIIKLLEETK